MTARAKGLGLREVNSRNIFPLPQYSTNIRNTSMPPNVMYHTKGRGKVHPCTGTEALYRPYGP